MGKGVAKAFIEYSMLGVRSIGIAFDEAATEGLPDFVKEYSLELPEKIPPFDHIGVNWQPRGHAPHELGVPHFDFHFYMIPVAKKNAITCDFHDFRACARQVPASLVPPNYFATRTVPRMGAHWYDKTNDAFCGRGFSSTFVFGYYDGGLVFIEPMITRDFVRSRETFTAIIPQPAQYEKQGDYPLSYALDFDPSSQMHRVYLQDFSRR